MNEAVAPSSSVSTAQQALRELIGWPLLYAAEGAALGVTWPRGLLLHGPPGTGKTMSLHAVAQEFDVEVHTITADRVVGGFTGQSERQLREAFAEAEEAAAAGKRVVIFLDEVDALCPRRTDTGPHEARIAAQLLALLDGAAGSKGGRLPVVAATNRPNDIEPALRRPGRLDREIQFVPPGVEERAAILQQHAKLLPLEQDVSLDAIAAYCVGYTGADLAALCRQAAMRALAAGTPRDVGHADFRAALAEVRPSLVRGAEVDLPKVSWDDIGGLAEVKRRLRQAVEWPLEHADAFRRLGLARPRGVLLHGPPGCCKTTLARAAAGATAATFLPLSGAQLQSMYVGEGEAALRRAFARARLVAPAVIFIDELDSVAAKREDSSHSSGADITSARLLSALLVEMDGLELASGILVLAATNRPAAVDAALLRPGRLDVLLYVPPPDAAGRLQVLEITTRKMPVADDVDLAAIAAATDMFTGAELVGLCWESALAALREDLKGATKVRAKHFAAALSGLQPAMTAEELDKFASWQPA